MVDSALTHQIRSQLELNDGWNGADFNVRVQFQNSAPEPPLDRTATDLKCGLCCHRGWRYTSPKQSYDSIVEHIRVE